MPPAQFSFPKGTGRLPKRDGENHFELKGIGNETR